MDRSRYIAIGKFTELITETTGKTISRQAIYQAIDRGALPAVTVNGKKKIDTNDLMVKEYMATVENRRPAAPKIPKRSATPREKKADPPPSKPDPVKPRVRAKPKPRPVREESDDDEGIDPYEKYRLDLKKVKLQNEGQEIKNAQARGDLIPADFTALIFSAVYSVLINEYLQIGPALSARICESVFKTNDEAKLIKAQEHIDDATRGSLIHIKREIEKRLKEIGEVIDE